MNIQSIEQTVNKSDVQGGKNIIGMIASPRKNGNTAWIVNKILEGANERGCKTQSFNFSDLDINPCRGCNGCKQNDRGCVIHDDMQKLYDALEYADTLVLGSPIYMGQMSAQAKIFTDRLYARFSPRFSPYFKEKNAAKQKLVLVFNQGNPDFRLFQSYIDYTKHMFELLEFDVMEVPVITGMRNGPALEREDLHTLLKNIGSSLASE
jgi:multimeric flavodoxin WrbA